VSWKQLALTVKAAREIEHPRPRELAGGAVSFLEMSAVTDTTKDRYRGHALRFLEWLSWHEHDFSTASQLDVVVISFLTDLALDGFDSATGRMTVAALRHYLPHLLGGKRPLPRATRALDAWRTLPRAAAMAVAGWMISMNLPSMAVYAALVFHAYLRPSEAYRLSVGSLVPPIADSSFNAWGLIVSDAKSGRPGKTGVTDESVLVDAPELWPVLHALTLGASTDSSLWNFRPAEVRAKLAQGLQQLGLQKESPSLYTIRHGGASHDLLSGSRTIAEVKEGRRWISDQSLRRYGKRTRMQQRSADLPPTVAYFGEQVFSRLAELIETRHVT
ncbi:unnamed protein product, partial [Prorocentrum cordatum]